LGDDQVMGPLVNGISALIKEVPETATLQFSHVRTHKKLQLGGASPGVNSASILILDLIGSRTISKKFLYL
jgi:hypothetical protein